MSKKFADDEQTCPFRSIKSSEKMAEIAEADVT